jgi:hypothetical protein
MMNDNLRCIDDVVVMEAEHVLRLVKAAAAYNARAENEAIDIKIRRAQLIINMLNNISVAAKNERDRWQSLEEGMQP